MCSNDLLNRQYVLLFAIEEGFLRMNIGERSKTMKEMQLLHSNCVVLLFRKGCSCTTCVHRRVVHIDGQNEVSHTHRAEPLPLAMVLLFYLHPYTVCSRCPMPVAIVCSRCPMPVLTVLQMSYASANCVLQMSYASGDCVLQMTYASADCVLQMSYASADCTPDVLCQC